MRCAPPSASRARRRCWRSRRRTAACSRDPSATPIPIFYDEAAAKARGYRSIVAPPGFLGTPIFNPAAPPARRARWAGAASRIPYKRVLNGGTDYEYFPRRTTSSAPATRSPRARKIAGFEETTGSLGPMLITKRETTYTNQNGKVVAKMYGTVIQY